MTEKKPLLILIGGPTGVGKTQLVIELAKTFKTDIISTDSRQLYHELNIGVAKPSKSQLSVVKHHFINHISIHQEYSAGQFEKEALDIITDLFEDKSVIFATGGTGLYMKAITDGLDDFPDVDRTYWENIFQSEGIDRLQLALSELDPEYFQRVDTSNPHRLIRALSVIRETGTSFTSYLKGSSKNRPYRVLKVALERDRQELYLRINQRVDDMMNEGLLEEVKQLREYRHLQSLQTVGYKELFEFLDGSCSLEYAIEKIKQHSRNYAKRQMTWYRNQGRWIWINAENKNALMEKIEKSI